MRWLAVLFVLAVALPACSDDGSSRSEADRRAVADEAMDDFVHERFSQVEEAVATELRDTLSAEAMREVWSRAVEERGGYERADDPVLGDASGADLFDYPLEFERGAAHLQVVVDDAGQIVGLLLRPGEPTGRWQG